MRATLVQPEPNVLDRSLLMMRKAVRLIDEKLSYETATGRVNAELLDANFYALPDETRDYLNEIFSDPFVHDFKIILIFAKMVVNNTDPKTIEDVAYYCKNAGTQHLNEEIVERFRWDNETVVQYQPIHTDITGMGYYSKLDDTYAYRRGTAFRKQSDLAKKQIAALFRLHEYAHHVAAFNPRLERHIEVTANNTIEPYQIAQLAVDHPERVDEIIRIIDDRREADAVLVASVLAADSKALAEGIL